MAAFWKSLTRKALGRSGATVPPAIAALVQGSDLFDPAWYLARYPDIRAAGTDPIAHYVLHGGFEGRDPGPDFSSEAYLAAHADVAAAGINPLVHYLQSGRDEGRAIAASEAGRAHEADVALVAASPFFDRDWYVSEYPDVAEGGGDPAAHYVAHGATEGRNPGPAFSTAWYLAQHGDVARDGLNPLVHYLRTGQAEGRAIAPASTPQASAARGLDDIALVASSEFFNRNWYLARYPDVADSETDPAEHYTTQGFKENRDPGPRFSTAWYLAEYKDVAAYKINPLVHFLRIGKAQGRASGPDMAGLLPSQRAFEAAPAAAASDVAFLVQSGWFEPGWYLEQYPDVAGTGLDPAAHYIERGAWEGRDPGPRFSTRWYLAEHTDVASGGSNPLLHYLRNGIHEGREIAPSPRAGGLAGGPAEPPLSFPVHRPAPPPHIVWHSDLDGAADAMRCCGTPAGTAPHGDDAHAALQRVLDRFAALAGADTPPDNDAPLSAGLATSAAALTDIWLTTACDMRLRFACSAGFAVVRVYQKRDGALVLTGEALAGESDPSLIDATLRDPFRPVLITVNGAGGELQSAEIVPFPSLCRGGPHYAETCAATGADGYLATLRALSAEYATKRGDATRSLTIAVELSRANGAEPIFQPALKAWLAGMGVALKGANPPADAGRAAFLTSALGETAGDRSGPVLTLPADAIPAIAALLAQESELPAGGPVPFLVTADSSRAPRWALQPPSECRTAAAGWPWLSRRGDRTPSPVVSNAPLAIRICDMTARGDGALLFPVPPDRSAAAIAAAGVRPADPTISVIIAARRSTAAQLASLLETLALQTCAADLDVTVVGDTADACEALERLFPGRHAMLHAHPGLDQSAAVNRAAARSDSRFLLFVDAAMLLHDARTAEVLRALADDDGVASAGCMTIAEIKTPNGARFAAQAHGIMATAVNGAEAVFSQPDLHTVLAGSTFPVAANGAALFMARSDRWRRLGGFDALAWPGRGADIDYGLRALRMGLRHVCTAAVTATVWNDGASPQRAPAVARKLTDADIDALRRHAGLVREIGG